MLRLESLESRCVPVRLTYTLIDFGPGTVGEAINNLGVAVGGYGRDSPFLVLSDGRHQPLPASDSRAEVFAMNDNLQMVGDVSHGEEVTDAAAWDGPTHFIELGTFGGPFGSGRGVNRAGELVSWAELPSGASNAWMDSGSGLVDLGSPDVISYANAVNDQGIIVGESDRRAVSWDAEGHLTELGVPDEGGATGALAINDVGQIAGLSGVAPSGVRTWIYQDGQVTYLPDLGSGVAQGTAMNGKGDVVGTALATDGHYRAVLWHHGQITDLNGPWTPLGWTLQNATGVNDRGQIVGTALDGTGIPHGFILSPVRTVAWAEWALAMPHRAHQDIVY